MQNPPTKPNFIISLLESMGLKQSLLYKWVLWLITGPYAVLKMTSAAVTASTTFGFYFYSLGYLFIYGYYLSGELGMTPSLFSLTINPIPLNNYSVNIVSLFLFISTFCLVFMGTLIKQKNLYLGIAVIALLLLLHIALSLFFLSSHIEPNQFLQFSTIWIIPIILALNIYAFIKMFKSPFLFTSGFIYISFFIFLALDLSGFKNISQAFDKDSLSYSILAFFITPFLSGIYVGFFEKRYKRNISRFLVVFPLSFIIVAGIYSGFEYISGYSIVGEIYEAIQLFTGYIISPFSKLKLLLILIISFFINLRIAHFITKKQRLKFQKEINERRIQNTDESNENTSWNFDSLKTLSSIMLCVAPCVLMLLCAFSAVTSLVAGNYIRTFSPEGFRKLQVIEDYTNHKTIKGTILKIEGDIYYISNQDWELEILRTDSIQVKSEKKEANK